MCVLLVLVYLQVKCVKINIKSNFHAFYSLFIENDSPIARCSRNGTRDSEIVPASKIAINVSPGTRNERQG